MNKSKRALLQRRRNRRRLLERAIDRQMERQAVLLPPGPRSRKAPPDRTETKKWLILAG